MSSARQVRLSPAAKAVLALRVWRSFLVVLVSMKNAPLQRLTRTLGGGSTRGRSYPPELLSHAVARSLRIGGRQPRCLITSLVLFKLLREQGDEPELVIGLPKQAPDHRAHAWIELHGRDVGPPPGGKRHAPLARYGPTGVSVPSTHDAPPTSGASTGP